MMSLFCMIPTYHFYKKRPRRGGGCGAVGRVVATDIHSLNPVIWQTLYYLYSVNCIEKTKIKRKEDRNGPFFKKDDGNVPFFKMRLGMAHFLKKRLRLFPATKSQKKDFGTHTTGQRLPELKPEAGDRAAVESGRGGGKSHFTTREI